MISWTFENPYTKLINENYFRLSNKRELIPYNHSLEIYMRLEQLRENDIGTTFAWVPSLGNGTEAMARLTYLQFSQLAFYYSAQQIEQLEFSTDQIQQGNATQTAVGFWFISIEAYINSILRVACLVKKLSFDDLKTKDFGPRIGALFEILEVDRTPFYAGAFQKLEEFKRYRNELFHDRTNDKPIEFHKTTFSGNPTYANQVDVMQASAIALETYHSFRHVIPKIDLMPQIIVTKEDSFFYAKIDRLYNEVLKPYFLSALAKHSLTSSVVLDINSEVLEESPTLSSTPIKIIVKAIPDERYQATASKEETQIGKNLFDRFREKVNFDTKTTFKIGDFYR